MKALIVEDDDMVRKNLVRTLQGRMNFAVTEAISVASTRRAISNKENKFHLCLLDANLSDGNGIDTIELIKRYQPHAKIIVMTGQVDENYETTSFFNGADDFVNKPFTQDALKARIETRMKNVSYEDLTETSSIQFSSVSRIIRNTNTLKSTILNERSAKILDILIKNNQKVVTRNDIAAQLGDPDYDVSQNRSIDMHIKAPRSQK